jgi:hypothetical protein
MPGASISTMKRRELARQFNKLLEPRKGPRQCRCRRLDICCRCGGPAQPDYRYGDVIRGHNVCAICLD